MKTITMLLLLNCIRYPTDNNCISYPTDNNCISYKKTTENNGLRYPTGINSGTMYLNLLRNA